MMNCLSFKSKSEEMKVITWYLFFYCQRMQYETSIVFQMYSRLKLGSHTLLVKMTDDFWQCCVNAF